MDNYGLLSLAPAFVALVLAFVTRNALVSILIGVVVGVVITGQNIFLGLSAIMQSALGNADFIWVISIEISVGIMIALFQKSGAITAFGAMIPRDSM